ncbi:DNA repair protein RecO [Robiginitomaculum antarcticum]|uniref:DNA repair protein RecO n=1 Tax=Robiginitomaculum antarcticum TaxID=437507 RepID=UPI000376B847|nr:DNA repair protein RecO [Robiginitomaculum antarcticum]
MEWTSDGIVLSVRKHGETSAIIDVLTPDKGRHPGLVRGGVGRRMRPVLQPGNSLRVTWRARLSEHLGYMTAELLEPRFAEIMDDRKAIAALNAICAVATAVMPERETHKDVYDATAVLLSHLHNPDVWPALYVRWEAGLLSAMGYGLDLSCCAASGVTDNLTHVSPRSGRAVCAEQAAPYLDKLFVLPQFLRREGQGWKPSTPGDIVAGLYLTGEFLRTRILWPANKDLPEARERMVGMISG